MKENVLPTLIFLCLLLLFPEKILSTESIEMQLNSIRTALVAGATEMSFNHVTQKNLYDLIDGGAEVYIRAGLIKGFHQKLKKDSALVLEIMVMQMKNSRKADKLQKNQKGSNADCGSLTQVPDVFFCHEEASGGVFSVSSFDNYYVELTIWGKTSKKTGAALTEKTLSKIYHAISKGS